MRSLRDTMVYMAELCVCVFERVSSFHSVCQEAPALTITSDPVELQVKSSPAVVLTVFLAHVKQVYWSNLSQRIRRECLLFNTQYYCNYKTDCLKTSTKY